MTNHYNRIIEKRSREPRGEDLESLRLQATSGERMSEIDSEIEKLFDAWWIKPADQCLEPIDYRKWLDNPASEMSEEMWAKYAFRAGYLAGKEAAMEEKHKESEKLGLPKGWSAGVGWKG